ncbi:hypothetical protein ACIA5C_05860 [Actinoplanes sp. NPDC051343]|uniref:hypothetical protein n=1 Tax=Actinoplanes sp. NPDC051343 TaxID=3363906 RepID=UPI0037B23FD6
MLATVGVIAGLVLGVVAGLLAKPERPRFSSCCGTTLGCVTCVFCVSCGNGGEVARAAPNSGS